GLGGGDRPGKRPARDRFRSIFTSRRQSRRVKLTTRTATAVRATRLTNGLPFVINAASAGTIIEWYDFYLYATLTPFLAPLFFPSDNPTSPTPAAFPAYA